jgi:cyclophilin family peptidyl-prolyl cis-trans isomerase/protein-disulfide isomerase
MTLSRGYMKLKLPVLIAFYFLIAACTAQPTESPTAIVVPELETSAPISEVGCSIINSEPTPTVISIFPAVTQEDYSTGPADATVTIVEYCDFQAPICQSMAAVMSNVVSDHVEDVRFVFRPVPLIGQLDKSELAVQAVIAAGEQDRFWEMYNILFQKNDDWAALTPEAFETWLRQEAVSAGLDGGKFPADLKSAETVTRMNSMYEAARNLGLQAVPLLVINDEPQPSFAIDYNSIESTISLIALGDRQFTECPPFSINPAKQYIATLHTEKGDVVLQLFPDKAPLAVNSFVFLARQGWFDGVTFHRVIPGFMAQTGDPSGSGRGNPGYLFDNEIDPALKFDRAGLVGMANSGPDTNGSQFFITFGPAPHLDGGYTIFGEVLTGMDVLEQLTPRDPEQSGQPLGDTLLNVEIEER